MSLTTGATITLGAIFAITLGHTVFEVETSPTESETNPKYWNITPMCPETELCQNHEHADLHYNDFGCQCREMCSLYDTCCRDSPFFVPSTEIKYKFTCVKLPIAFMKRAPPKIKTIASCSQEASSKEKQLCETLDETNYLLSVIPITVTANNLSIIYRNVFCARCNNVMNASYHLWDATFICDAPEGKGIFPDDAEASWDPEKKRWIYVEGNRSMECDLKLIKPDDFDSILPYARCQTMTYVDQCPEGADLRDARLCKSYTVIVGRRGNRKLYKNPHCFKCHGGSADDIECLLATKLVMRTGFDHAVGDYQKYSVLLRYVRSECGPGLHYDSVLKDCVQLFPPRVAHHVQNATPIDACARAKLSAHSYELSADGEVVVVPKYKRNFTQGQFRLTEDGELEICERDVPPHPPTILSFTMTILRIVGFSASIVFLLLHLCAVFLVAELRNLSGLTLASLCVALLGGYFSFIVGIFIRDVPYLYCYCCAIITYYFFMASFFWMLVLAFDVSKVLRASVRQFRAIRGFKRRRFLVYSSIAWGVPVLSCLVAHFVDNAEPGSVNDRFRPMFGVQGCWFVNPDSHLVFFITPLTVIMLLNFSLFLYAARVTSENPSGQRKNIGVYVKLTILLGLNWLVGLVGRLLDSEVLIIIFAVLDGLQGMFIFLSFTMTSKVSKGLSEKILCLKKSSEELSHDNTQKETSFSSKARISSDSMKN